MFIKIKKNAREVDFSGVFRPKFGYDVDDNGYLVPCEKEQSIIRLMKILRKKGNSYKKIAEVVTKSTRKILNTQDWGNFLRVDLVTTSAIFL